jgi:hypothetical protein
VIHHSSGDEDYNPNPGPVKTGPPKPVKTGPSRLSPTKTTDAITKYREAQDSFRKNRKVH